MDLLLSRGSLWPFLDVGDQSEAFSNTLPDQDPERDGTAVVFGMRFPGQRYDTATGLNQNYFRDYDASTGRYGQSDPIGLMGGASTFFYVGGYSSLED